MKKFHLTLRKLRHRTTERPVSISHDAPDELMFWNPTPPSAPPVADIRAAHARRTLEHTSSHIC